MPVPVIDPNGGPARDQAIAADTVDVRALAPLAIWARATLGESAFQSVCASAGIATERVTNGGGRLPVPELDAWLAALRERVASDETLLAAALGGGAPTPGRPRWLRWIATPGLLYRGRAGHAWMSAEHGRVSVRMQGLCAATIRYTAAGTGAGTHLLCLWRRARLAERPRAWGLPSAVVRETRCLGRGDEACEYVVHWHMEPRWTAAMVAAAAAVASLAAGGVATGIAWTLPAIAAGAAHAIETARVAAANRRTTAAFGAAFRRAVGSVATRGAGAEPPVAAAVPANEVDEPFLRQEGDVWRIGFASKTVLIRHSRGLSLLVHLLRNPGVEMHVSALDASSPSDGGGTVRSGYSGESDAVSDLGDAGEVLDAQAKATYRRRLVELREELEDAETCNDIGRAENLRAELDALADQLRQATGLGGRSRRASSNAERVRVAVTRRIRAAIVQIAKHHEPLGDHLTATIHTGYFCSYGPGGVTWRA